MSNLLKAGRPSENKSKFLSQLETDEVVKMNINIKKGFHKDVKRFALENNITVTELIHKALYLYMKL